MKRRQPLICSLVLLCLAAGNVLVGCGGEETHIIEPPRRPRSPEIVLYSLQHSYRYRNVKAYAGLLADDFRFYFDDSTRAQRHLPEYWTRGQDSTGTGALFARTDVSDILISLQFGLPRPVFEPGREEWMEILVHNVMLDIEFTPTPDLPEGKTWLVKDRPQRFYFRKGRTAADTLDSSPTAGDYYLVEWRELIVSKPD